MRIALVGKGGSGKTTLTALLARTLAAQGAPVIAIDADINQHLGVNIGMSPEEAAALPPMGQEMFRIKDYVRGNNPLLADAASMIKTTPPGEGSRLLSFGKENPLFSYFARTLDGIRIMAVGPFSEEDLGVHCYHSKTGSVELLLNHLIDGAGEYVLVDMTAGADSFASGLFTRFDITFLVVEPTLKSVSVYRQYKAYAKEHDVCVRVVGNKAENDADEEYLREHIGDDLIAVLRSSAFVRATDKGAHGAIADLERENAAALRALIAAVDARKKDWKKFYEQAVLFHAKNAESWASAAAGKDLLEQIDPSFNMERAAAA